jgi:proteic killer suppression protein
VIRSFKSKALRDFAEKGKAAKLPAKGRDRVRRILVLLDAATNPSDMNVPGLYFHKLRGNERFSVRITGNWRITFAWTDKDAVDVDIEDYH